MSDLKISIEDIILNTIIYSHSKGDFIFKDINTSVEKTEHICKDEIIGKSMNELFPRIKESGLFDVLLRVHESGVSEKHCSAFYENEDIAGWRNNWVSRLDNGDVLVIYDTLSKEKYIDRENMQNKWQLEEAQRLAHLGWWEWDKQRDTVFWSDEMFRIFGEKPLSFVPTFDILLSYFDEEGKLAIMEALQESSSKGEFHFLDRKIYRKDGTVRHLQCSGKKEFDTEGLLRSIMGTVLDISTQREAENKLKSLGIIIENSINEVYIFDAKSLYFTYANKKAQKNIGYTLEELTHMTPMDIKPEYIRSKFMALIQPLIEGSKEYLVFETIHQRKDGSKYNVEVRIQCIENGSDKQFVVMAHDISNRVRMEEKLHKMATTDFLTGIDNRHKTSEELNIEIARCKRYNGSFALLMFDIDFFKKINDTYGHSSGDYVLKELCNVISEEIRESDRFGRWGGEEFLIIMPSLNREQALEFSEKLRHSVEVYRFKNISKVTISMGVSVFNEEDTNGSLLKRVDEALYMSKREGRNRVSFK